MRHAPFHALSARAARRVLAPVSVVFALALPAAATQGPQLSATAYQQAVAEALIDAPDTVAEFYRDRAFAPLWTGAGADHQARRAALLAALSRAGDHGLPVTRYAPDTLIATLRAATNPRAQGAAELAMTRAYLAFAHDLTAGLLDPQDTVNDIKRDNPRRASADLLDRVERTAPNTLFRMLEPQSPEYTRLMHAKMMLERRIAEGGWGPRVPGGKLEQGDSGARVIALRDRLFAMGYLPDVITAEYDAAMADAVQQFQLDHGLAPDGISGDATLAAINVPARERLKSVLVALERERWMNLEGGKGARHILVNLTDFHARVMDDGKETFVTRSVIGHRARDRQSPEFSDEMDHMVINPYWFVPRSIIVGEYLPNLRENPQAHSYLQIMTASGRQVSRQSDFSQFTAASFPFSMRQPPGPRNALGSVKFMFPNRYNIYLHDTPQQHLFARAVRAYSHGCIRLDDPHEFAYTLLAPQQADPVGYFQRILRSGENTRVDLVDPVPVHLIYRTAFTRAKGAVQYRGDIYGRDARIWQALDRAGVVLPGTDG